MIVTVVGTGKLGSSMAALFAAAGHTVYCVDRNQEFLDAIRDRRAPVQEPGLQELIDQHGDRMLPVGVDQCHEAVRRSEFVFIIVPTPSTARGDFSNEFILDALEPIKQAIVDGARPHIVVTCTTSPGACENVLIPSLQETGCCPGVDFGFSYNPEFIALGSVIRDMRNPDFILIGSVLVRWADHLRQFYEELHRDLGDPQPTVAKMSLVNAEITKLAVNCFCTMKISYANQLARLCEAIPGADAKTVTDALGLDARIGRKYLAPASIFGGPCFPRDGRAFEHACRATSTTGSPLVEATQDINQMVVNHFVDLIDRGTPDRLAILGLSYKPDTPMTDESLATQLIPSYAGHLTENIRLHDPMAKIHAAHCRQFESAQEAVQDADVVVIATAWPEYRELKPEWFKRSCLILDLWNVLDPEAFRNHNRYVPGRGPACNA
jgi:UDPglucose 6-dehydrogenase